MPYDNIISRSDAGALIPEEVLGTFLANLSNESSVLNDFTRVPVGRDQVRFPVLSALPIAYWVTGDTGQKQTTEVNWDNKFMSVEELAMILPIPEAVLDDSGYPIWSQVRPLCEQAGGRLIDSAVYFGAQAPASFPAAVVASAIAAGNVRNVGVAAAAAGGVVEDHSDLLAQVEADGYDPRAGVASRTLRGLARSARNADGQRYDEITITPDTVEVDGVVYRFPMRGQWPIGAGSATAIMFDPSEFVVGVRQDVTWKLLDQAVIQDNTGAIRYNLAQQDMVALRMVMRVGWQVANTINYDEPDEADRYPAGVLRVAP